MEGVDTKEVFEQYGGVMIAAVVGTFILAMLCYGKLGGKSGIGEVAGTFLAENSQGSLQYTRNKAYEDSCNQRKPVIQYQGERELLEGQNICVEEVLEAKDCKEMNCIVQVLKITNGRGENYPFSKEGMQTFFCPSEAGIYAIWVEATDQWGETSEVRISIPVQTV